MTEFDSASRNARMRLAWYGLTVFLGSAILLVIEIVAGRLIAPYVGVSLYSWTSIIGVILAGLSFGSWIGGRWADRGAGEAAVGWVLALAGVFSLASLFILTLVAPVLQASDLDLISASFLYVLTMFFVPAVLLGVVTPLLTTLALAVDERAGHIVGRMHALAALGSIIGTFATGYWLLQYFGSRAIIIATALILFALAAPFLRQGPRAAPALILLIAAGITTLTFVRNGFATPCHRESNYFCLRVVDATDQSPFGEARALVLDHLIHGINHSSEPAILISPYVHLIDELILGYFGEERAKTLRYFFAGGGAFTQPRAVRAMSPDAHVTVAELDETVTAIAADQLFVDTRGMRIIHRDARATLNRLNEQFDVIVTDAFHDIAVPYHLMTREFAETVRGRLAPDGLYAVNIVDAFPDPRLVKSLVKTLQAVFPNVDVWMEAAPEAETRVTYVVSAGTRPMPSVIRAQRGLQRAWLRVNEPLSGLGTKLESLPQLRDDFVPVERLASSLLLGKQGR